LLFASRRRHTRWVSDWSSDVCSSDLTTSGRSASARDLTTGRERTLTDPKLWDVRVAATPDGRLAATTGNDSKVRLWEVATGRERSEERRVGKEGKCRWGQEA